jgi:hypothetical protein
MGSPVFSDPTLQDAIGRDVFEDEAAGADCGPAAEELSVGDNLGAGPGEVAAESK